MKILITGAAGFIGSFLFKRALDDGYDVSVLERYTKGKLKRLRGIAGGKTFKLIWADATKSLDHADFSPRGYDFVFHLIGKRNTPYSNENPVEFHKAHVSATVNVLEIIRRIGTEKFIYTTSATCFGEADVFPTPETAKIHLDSPYALTKYLGEKYTLHFGRVYKLPVIILRPFNVYGPNLWDSGHGALLDNFILQKKNQGFFTVFGDGKQMRDFLYIDDLVSAYLKSAKSEVLGEVFNVGSGEERSIKVLLKMLGGEIKYEPKRGGDIPRTYADIRKIKKMIDWKPEVKLEDGIRKVIDEL